MPCDCGDIDFEVWTLTYPLNYGFSPRPRVSSTVDISSTTGLTAVVGRVKRAHPPRSRSQRTGG